MLNENTKFNLSIGKVISIIIAVVGLGFTAGTTYQSILPDRQLQEKQSQEIQDIKITLAKVSTILETMQETQQDTKADISALHDKTNKTNSEVVLISSYVREDDRKKKR